MSLLYSYCSRVLPLNLSVLTESPSRLPHASEPLIGNADCTTRPTEDRKWMGWDQTVREKRKSVEPSPTGTEKASQSDDPSGLPVITVEGNSKPESSLTLSSQPQIKAYNLCH